MGLLVVLPQILQVHSALPLEVGEVVSCTQVPSTRAKTGLKRLRKEQQGSPFAGGVCTPRPQRSERSKQVSTEECRLAVLTLQTPMLQSEAGSAFGPLPPDSTPPPQRGNFLSAGNLGDIAGVVVAMIVVGFGNADWSGAAQVDFVR